MIADALRTAPPINSPANRPNHSAKIRKKNANGGNARLHRFVGRVRDLSRDQADAVGRVCARLLPIGGWWSRRSQSSAEDADKNDEEENEYADSRPWHRRLLNAAIGPAYRRRPWPVLAHDVQAALTVACVLLAQALAYVFIFIDFLYWFSIWPIG